MKCGRSLKSWALRAQVTAVLTPSAARVPTCTEAWPKLVHTAIVSVSYSPDSASYPNFDLFLCKSGKDEQQVQESSDLSNGDWRVGP